MQLFTICFCNIFAPKNQKKTKSEYEPKKKVKARRAPKKKRKQKKKNK